MTHPEAAPDADLPEHDHPVDAAQPEADDPSFAEVFAEAFAPDEPEPPRDLSRHHVTTIVVSHDGGRWLRRTLTTLARQSRPTDAALGVDTGSVDRCPALLREAFGDAAVQEVVPDPGFSAAVNTGVTSLAPTPDGRTGWIWLLHDDSAPEADALERLLTAVDLSPSIAIVGPKVLGWGEESRRLLEVGVSISGSGHRETGLERRELDQGQHDGQHDVLAVGSAGALIRRDVWEQLGGFDDALRQFREDVDLGWRATLAGHRVVVTTDAVVHHVEATARSRRPVPPEADRPRRTDRRCALYVLLANRPAAWLPWVWLRLVLGSVARGLGLLAAKAPAEAIDEFHAMDVLVQFGVIRRARAARAATRTHPAGSVRPLMPPPGRQLRQSAEAFAGTVSAFLAATAPATGRPQDAVVVESGPGDDVDDSFEPDPLARWLAVARRPVVLLSAGLLALSLLAWRSLYAGGALLGGALLPAPAGASDLWSTYVAGWHPVSIGSSTPSPPYLAVLAGVATVLLGKAGWAVAWLFALSIPVAGLLAYVATRPLILSRRIRVWASAAYALTPALLAGVAQGRLAVVVVAVLLPLIALAAGRVIGADGHVGTWRSTAALVLLLAAVEAFAPVVWLIVAVLAIVAAFTWLVDLPGRLRLLAIAVGPVLLLLPWSGYVLLHPSLLLLEAGSAVPAPVARPWSVALLSPGGLAAAPVLLGIGILVAGLAAVLRLPGSRLIQAASVVAAVAFGFALLTATITVTPPTSAVSVPTYPGPALVVCSGALIAAAAAAARHSARRLSQESLGWRQPSLVAVAVLALLSPILLGSWWLWRGADGPLHRGEASVLPAFVAASANQPARVRTLVLQPVAGRLYYSVLRAQDPQLGDVELQPPASSLSALDSLVSQVASGSGVVPAEDLAQYAIRYVLVPAPVDADLERALDSVPGLSRVANPEGSALWQVSGTVARLRLHQSGTVSALPSDVVTATPVVPGTTDGILDLAERASGHWQAVDAEGHALDGSVRDGWAQDFAAPATSGQVRLTYRDSWRIVVLLIQLALVGVTVVLALPGRRREAEPGDTDDGDDGDDLDDADGGGDPTRGVAVSVPATAPRSDDPVEVTP
jgi:GT2 family glycosyltransferase